jgi:hypothetical protein
VAKPTKSEIEYQKANMVGIKTLIAEEHYEDKFVCKVLGISPQVWLQWQKLHPEFKQALKDWKKLATKQIERKLFERAVGYDYESEKLFCYEGVVVRAETVEHVPPDIAAVKMWLTNQSNGEWKDKVEASVDATGTLAELINKARGRSGLAEAKPVKEIESSEDDMEFLK